MAGFATIDEALQDLRDGKLILVIDDPDRENEGDLICAAEFATTENVNAMASLAKGLICMPMSKEMTKKLGLDQMVAVNTDNHSTAFTVSIDHVDTTTGISAVETGRSAGIFPDKSRGSNSCKGRRTKPGCCDQLFRKQRRDSESGTGIFL